MIKKHSDSINTLISKYNKLVHETADLTLPPGSVVPAPIDPKDVFTLNVADAVWDDSQLDEPRAFGAQVPDWLRLEDVQKGIRAEHDLFNCERELVRQEAEVANLHAWVAEQLLATELAIQDQPSMFALLNLRTKLSYSILVRSRSAVPHCVLPALATPTRQKLEDKAWRASICLLGSGFLEPGNYHPAYP